MMRAAMEQAKLAFVANEVPIGAVIAHNDTIIARAHNLTETLCDPTAHAEMQAITAAANKLGAKYLTDCTIYVTLEPCPMCAAALKWAQIKKIVWAANDPKFGYSTIAPNVLHPKTSVASGLMESEAAELLKSFFKKLRH